MNSGVNLRRAAVIPALEIRSPSRLDEPGSDAFLGALNPSPELIIALISPAPRLLVMKIRLFEKSTRRLSPNVSVALSRMPSNRFHNASLAFSISSNSTKATLRVSVWYWLSTSWLSKRCVSRCPRYPGGEPINFAISWLCWNSPQSILTTARGSPSKVSAVASTILVLPVPVGPKNRKFAIGRPGLLSPARYV